MRKPRRSRPPGMAGFTTPSICRRPRRDTSRARGRSRIARIRPARRRRSVRPGRRSHRAAARKRPATTRPGCRAPAPEALVRGGVPPRQLRLLAAVFGVLTSHSSVAAYNAGRIAGHFWMVRHRLLLIVIAAALASVEPVAAQFGAIFGGPPRPPGDIPQASPPNGDDRYYPARPQQRWTREPRVVTPPPQGYPSPYPQQGYPQQGYPQQGYPQQGYPEPQQASRPPAGG